MPFVLLLVFAVGVAWFLRDVTFDLLVKIDQDKQKQRLANIVQRKKAIPLQAFVESFRDRFAKFSNAPQLNSYMIYLENQLRRANVTHLKPIDLLAYQLLGSFGSGLILGLLAGSLELAIIGWGTGFAFPIIWLSDKVKKRELDLLRELPNALEVLALCSEAGLSLEQSMEQYLRNAKAGPLKDELSRIMDQTRSGAGRKKAFLSVTERLNLTDFSLFSTSVIQAERFGTGIAKTLQQLSLTIRDKQSQRAEKAVQEMPVKLLFPLIFCIMPVTFLIIFGPILLQFLNP